MHFCIKRRLSKHNGGSKGQKASGLWFLYCKNKNLFVDFAPIIATTKFPVIEYVRFIYCELEQIVKSKLNDASATEEPKNQDSI